MSDAAWRSMVRAVLGPLAGREGVVWPWVRSPRLRYLCIRDPVDCVIHALIGSQRRVTFVQIGSNDGRTHDPLWTFRRFRGWSGTLVEPGESAFERLVRNYAPWADRFAFERAAIADSSGPRPFYVLSRGDGSSAPVDQLGSLELDLVRALAASLGRTEARVVECTVTCMTFAELCEKHGVERLDLLHIDAEGFDHRILRQVDWERLHPSVVLYEHAHLDAGQRREASGLLRERGYVLMEVGGNTLAALGSALGRAPGLERAWRLASRDARTTLVA